MTVLRATIDGIGLLGPGLAGWKAGREALTGALPYASLPTEFPVAGSLPPSERRRASRATKLVLALGHEAIDAAGLEASAMATVFTSSAGDGYNCHEICQMLASSDRQLSPTRFHNSVHNAPAGYWSIASGSMAPSSVICAYDASFSAGLLEALALVAATGAPCTLIAYDTDYPEPIRAVRPLPDSFGIALVLGARPGARSIAQIKVGFTAALPTTLDDPAQEQLRRDIPAARGLPLLRALAQGTASSVVIEYLDQRALAIDIAPC